MDHANSAAKPLDPRNSLQGFLLLDIFGRLTIWGLALAATCAIFTALDAWPTESIIGAGFFAAWKWAQKMCLWIALFNIMYVMALVLLRLPIPTPREGSYTVKPGAKLDSQLVYSCILAVLTKARYEAPFPAFLVFQMANIPPMVWLMDRVFGPKSKSCYVTEPLIIDPHLVEIGRNVVFGFRTVVSGHTQARDEIIIKKTRIEDDVLIGGNVIIYSGCLIKRGAVVLGGAIVQPDTIIGEHEIWGGVPARKIKDAAPQPV